MAAIVTLSYGQYDTSFDSPRGAIPPGANWSAPNTIERSRSDGGTTTVSAWKGLELERRGFLTLGG